MKKMSSALIAASLLMVCSCGHEDSATAQVNPTPEEETSNNESNASDSVSTVNPFNFETRTIVLNSGYEMPIFGIGTYTLTSDQAEESVYNALKIGVRLFDTADIYGNERGVARGLQRGMQDFGIKREDIFVTTKLWTADFDRADEEIDERLERLGLDYIDLLLLHHTAPYDEQAYQAMERGVEPGKLHSIGISNFYEDDIDRLMKVAKIKPAVLQNETHPYHQGRSVKEHIAPLGTILESWYPLGGRGTGITTLTQHEVITSIAAAHNKSVYQVLIRWHLQSGNICIPGSSNAAHIAEDYDVFDFSLTDEEMQRIDALECNHRFSNY